MTRKTCWRPPPAVKLSRQEIHVWRTPLDQPASCLCELRSTLAPDETQKAERFRLPKDGRSYVVARGVLRTILGRYLNLEPRGLSFASNPHGKPRLWCDGPPPIRFNVSHSGALALLAFAADREVGVDIEEIRPMSDADTIVRQYFSPREQAIFRAIPPDEKQAAFFALWTRKEAYLKARGEGLSVPLDQFDVALDGDHPVTISQPDAPEDSAPWSIRELNPGDGYAGAVAAEGEHWQVASWQWEPGPA